MRTSAVLGIIMLVVYGVGTVHGRKYIKQLNIRLNIDTLAMLIEENNDVLTIGGGLLSPNQLINLNSAASSVRNQCNVRPPVRRLL